MFEVPESKKSIKQNRFQFGFDGKTYDIPQLKFAPAGAMEEAEQGHTITALVMSCETDEAKAAVRSMDGDQLNALIDAWGAASGVTMGESQASSDS